MVARAIPIPAKPDLDDKVLESLLQDVQMATDIAVPEVLLVDTVLLLRSLGGILAERMSGLTDYERAMLCHNVDIISSLEAFTGIGTSETDPRVRERIKALQEKFKGGNPDSG